jgi:hypothetical protein
MDWIDLGSGQELVEGSCEHGNELPGCIKCWDILKWPSDWRLLYKDSVAWN